MRPEIEPIVRRLDLADRGGGRVYEGSLGALRVTAMLTEIGMANARAAARRILDAGVEIVAVVGIAGSVDRSLAMGALIMPERVVERASGREHRPTFLGDHRGAGTLSCGDDLITSPETLDQMFDGGVIAVDMETAAVAAVCDDAGTPWSVFRAISDYAGSGFLDEELMALIESDGTAARAAMARYAEDHPDRIETLTQFAKDAELATDTAADAAVNALRTLT
jgi:nucleoside phosphorylase